MISPRANDSIFNRIRPVSMREISRMSLTKAVSRSAFDLIILKKFR